MILTDETRKGKEEYFRLFKDIVMKYQLNSTLKEEEI